MSADNAVQKALRARLITTAAVTDLVPASSILDTNARPAPDPSIIIGEGQSVDEGVIARDVLRVYCTLHIWKKAQSSNVVRAIAGAVRSALQERLTLEAGYHCADSHVTNSRFLRDPDGETFHGIVTVEVLVQEG